MKQVHTRTYSRKRATRVLACLLVGVGGVGAVEWPIICATFLTVLSVESVACALCVVRRCDRTAL